MIYTVHHFSLKLTAQKNWRLLARKPSISELQPLFFSQKFQFLQIQAVSELKYISTYANKYPQMIVSQILHVDIVTMYINISEYVKNDLYNYWGYI